MPALSVNKTERVCQFFNVFLCQYNAGASATLLLVIKTDLISLSKKLMRTNHKALHNQALKRTWQTAILIASSICITSLSGPPGVLPQYGHSLLILSAAVASAAIFKICFLFIATFRASS